MGYSRSRDRTSEDIEELERLFAEEHPQIPDHYAIICPICGHDEFEDIYVSGKIPLIWAKRGQIKFYFMMNKVQSLRCLRCDYILNFARE
jgi:hypothetical protein